MLGSDHTTYEGEDIVPMRGWWGCSSPPSSRPGNCSYKEYVDRFIAETKPVRGTTTPWTTLPNSGPNHLGLR